MRPFVWDPEANSNHPGYCDFASPSAERRDICDVRKIKQPGVLEINSYGVMANIAASYSIRGFHDGDFPFVFF